MAPTSFQIPKRPGARLPWDRLTAASCLTLVLIAGLVWYLQRSHATVRKFQEVDLAVADISGRITYLDEVLTMSALMAATSGDPQWEKRYLDHVALLDEAIAEANRLSPQDASHASTARTEAANMELVQAETRAFELVRAGRRQEAASLLASEDYARNKKIYANGVAGFLASSRTRIEAALQRERQGTRLGLTALGVLLPFLGLSWFSAIRSLRNHMLARTRAEQAARDANRAKSEFLANMSHEIRTPLTTIVGYADLVSTAAQSPAVRKDIHAIRESASHLLDLIEDVLDLSKIEAGKTQVEQAPVSPHQIMQRVASLMQSSAAERGLQLRVEFEGDIPEFIQSDTTRLRQILLNLVGNALKFTSEGGVTLRARRDGSRMRFEVIDSGIGIPAEQLENIFEPFVQADTSVTRRFGGTGLGLALSREFARVLGGDITVTSEVGQGSSFVVTVDAGSLDGVRMLAPEDLTLPAEDPTPSSAAGNLEGAVLVAEDSRVNQALFCKVLEKAGLSVDRAFDGEEAVAAVSARRSHGSDYDLILMDVMMPRLDGLGATRQLRAAGYEGVVLALTADAMEGIAEKCLEAGCDAYLSKPIRPAELVANVSLWLGRAARRQPAV